jgi:hypothetical protein
MPQIFISYRHGDSKPYVGRIYDRLVTMYDEKEVFRDVDSIKVGESFLQAIEEAQASCDALIAVIGPDWLTARDDEGRLRLEDPHDTVRREIETALAREMTVVQALVGGARKPDKQALPGRLTELYERKEIHVGDERFDEDMSRLVEAIGGAFGDVRVAMGESFAAAITLGMMSPVEMFLVVVDQEIVGGFGATKIVLSREERAKLWNPIKTRVREGVHTISVSTSRSGIPSQCSNEVSFRLKGGQELSFHIERETSKMGHPQLVVRPHKPIVEP